MLLVVDIASTVLKYQREPDSESLSSAIWEQDKDVPEVRVLIKS
jgi:hypothetical protein